MRRLAFLLLAGAMLVSAAIFVRWRYEVRHAGDPPLPADVARLDPELAALIHQAADAVRARGRDALAWLELGSVYHANGMIDLARSCLERAVALDPSGAPAWYHLAMIQDKFGEAEHAILSMRRAISIQPDYAPAHWRLGFWLLDQGALDDADASFAAAARIDPAHQAPRIGAARVHLQREEFQQAADILGALVAGAGPIANEAYIDQLLMVAQRRLGRHEEASDAIRPARRPSTPPGWPDPWLDELGRFQAGLQPALQRARMLASSGAWERAVEILHDLRARHPRDVPVMLTLAACRREQGRSDECLAILHEALNVSPDSSFVHTNLALAHLARGAQASGRQAQAARGLALQHADEALRANPALAVAHGAKGDILLASNRADEAVQAYLAAARFDADPTPWLRRAGAVHADRKQWVAAGEVFTQLTFEAPRDPHAWLALARARIELRELDAARSALVEADRLRPGDAQVQAAMREIGVTPMARDSFKSAEPR